MIYRGKSLPVKHRSLRTCGFLSSRYVSETAAEFVNREVRRMLRANLHRLHVLGGGDCVCRPPRPNLCFCLLYCLVLTAMPLGGEPACFSAANDRRGVACIEHQKEWRRVRNKKKWQKQPNKACSKRFRKQVMYMLGSSTPISGGVHSEYPVFQTAGEKKQRI